MFTHPYIYIILLFLLPISKPQAKNYSTEITSPVIKTLKIHETGWPLSYPAIELGSDRTILVSFDALGDDEKSYQYKLVHCNANHEGSDLRESEYLKGFYKGYIEDYDFSFNTNINYIHYSLRIPNESMEITKSGVYALVVFENDENAPILTACFYVYENLVNISPTVHHNTELGFRNHYQQVDVSISNPDYPIYDAMQETELMVVQNNRKDNAAVGIKPTFARPTSLIYTKNKDLTFEGGNEYFYFDATTSKYSAHGVDYVEFHRPYEHFVLFPYLPSTSKSYSYTQDVNGKLFIRRQEADQDALDVESDYIFVHFFVPKETPEFTGKLYLTGGMTQGKISKEFELEYNIDERRYELSRLLKQGRYDYRFLFVPKGSKVGHSEPFDADFYETENDYQAFFYHRSPNARYDRLVGYKLFDSIKFRP